MLQPILGIINFIGAIVIFSSAFIQGNFVLTVSIAALVFIQSLYYFFADEKNILKGAIQIISALILTTSVFVRIPFYVSIIVGIALIVVALYDVFPAIIGKG